MTNKQRTDLIEAFVREHKYADLHTLATRFSGSLSTVRRALDQLAERGIVRRHHGGASLVETDALAQEYDFVTRNQRQTVEKLAIARLIAAQVEPGMTVILDGGSTTYSVAHLLAEKRLQVITNSIPIASLFAEIGAIDTTVTGSFRAKYLTKSQVGPCSIMSPIKPSTYFSIAGRSSSMRLTVKSLASMRRNLV